MKKVIVITGASSGFGRLSANALAKAGHTVYASMRDTAGRNAPQAADVEKFARDNKVDLRPIELDVSSEKSIEAAIRQIVAEQGRLDVLMHNAGHMVFGPAEAFTPEQLAELYDINVLTTQRVNRAAPPTTPGRPARPPTRSARPSMKQVHTKAMERKSRKPLLPLFRATRMRARWRTQSLKSWTRRLANARSAFM